ncbi:MAG: hypothetical protein JWN73_916 [Betaproteobacteria bacterium]|nr:hypothetical protein [Betaproteobacteria bacterium]
MPNQAQNSLSQAAKYFASALLLCCGLAQAQTFEAVSIEGTPVKLVIPAGYCKLTRDAAPGQSFYATQDRMQQGTNLVLLIYADCNELAKVKTGGGLPHYGMYLAPLAGGHASKLPLTVSRAQAIDEVGKTVPALDEKALQNQSNARANAEGLKLDKMTTGLLGKDANALYIGIAANASAGAKSQRFHAVTLITFIKGLGISGNLYSPVEPGAPFDKLWAAQKLQAAALVKAN